MPTLDDIWAPEPGRLEIDESDDGSLRVFYIPQRQPSPSVSPTAIRAEIIRVDRARKRLTMYPIITTWSGRGSIFQKYDRIRSITLADGMFIDLDYFIEDAPSVEDDVMWLLDRLPPNFIKDYDYGLGLKRQHKPIIDAIENFTSANAIVISDQRDTHFDDVNHVFYLAAEDHEKIRKSVGRIYENSRTAARAVKDAEVFNFFADKLAKPRVQIKYGRGRMRRVFTDAVLNGSLPLTDDQQSALIGAVSENVKTIVERKPDELAVLKKEIELATLDQLIETFREMLSKRLEESAWQEFLSKNRFVLTLAFSYPVIVVRDRASVGGQEISGSGDTISDFLAKNNMTNNCAIIEIKTPHTPIITKGSYRTGLYKPSSEFAAAINQALDQKFELERGIAYIKDASRTPDLESYAVQCCLIIGKMPKELDKIKSFELFRGNSKHVTILTFDELLNKTKQLREFLTPH